jgi:excisionase family DNA binding protein
VSGGYDNLEASPGFDPSEGLLTAAEVAAALRVDTQTVWAWARNRKIPYLRTPGGEWRFSAAWLRQRGEVGDG